MANDTTRKIWSLDTVDGVVSQDGAYIHSIIVRMTTAAAGSFQMTFGKDGAKLLDIETTAASTAVVWNTSKQYFFGDQYFEGPIKKILTISVDTVYVITSSGK